MPASRSPATRGPSRPGTGPRVRHSQRLRVAHTGEVPIRRDPPGGGGGPPGGPGGPRGPGGPKDPGEPRPPRPDVAARSALRVRRSITLLALTLLVPGAAQLVAGPSSSHHHAAGLSRARLLVARGATRAWLGAATLTVLLACLALISREWVLGLFTHQWVIRPLAVVFFAGAVVWPLLLLDAWRIGQAPELTQRARRWIALLTAVLMLATFAVPLAFGRRAWAAADLLSGVFGSGKDSAAVDGRYNVLLLGGDTGPTRVGTRPDSINLASVDEKTGRTALFSLPRNLQNVPFPAGSPAAKALPHGYDCGDDCLLNAVYKYGNDNPSLFPGTQDPGAEAMMQAVEGVTGLKVNYYVIIDLRGFQSLIDAVGGIDILVTARTPIGGGSAPIHGWIETGDQHLDGYHALWYARSRATTSDYDRMARQRCVMTAMVNQLDPATVLKNFQSIASAGSEVMATDIPANRLPAFLNLAQKAKGSNIRSVQFVPPVIVPKAPDFAEIRRQVAATVKGLEEGGAQTTATSAPVSADPGRSAQKSPQPEDDDTRPAGSSSSTSPQASATSSRNASVDVRSVCVAG
ncbi:LCP family protein [Kineosporia sp. J2-2]|uniref:LCP family protein n=1 Tax=Kineosporia corallincola TaxID=2835133 RepID=A0ABS5TGY5_9ACTN|nr:LCP family protein [Kineosporia corallincola]MBT0770359.1 LCP family protein [Kineosporia corallincola]